MARRVIIHYHLFKNAGTSVDYSLKKSFGNRFAYFDGPNPWSVLCSEEISTYLDQNPTIIALSSHHARFPFPFGFQVYPIIFLRHPIDRVGSVYRYERSQTSDKPGAIIAREKSFADYIRWRLSDEGGVTVRNYHTIHLSDAQRLASDPRLSRANNADFYLAKARLDSLVAFGLVELFEASIKLFQKHYQSAFPELNFTVVKERSSPIRLACIDDRIQQVREELGGALYQQLLEENSLDLELYEYAHLRFEQLSHQEPLTSALSNFK